MLLNTIGGCVELGGVSHTGCLKWQISKFGVAIYGN
jgi:hypothetical protein